MEYHLEFAEHLLSSDMGSVELPEGWTNHGTFPPPPSAPKWLIVECPPNTVELIARRVVLEAMGYTICGQCWEERSEARVGRPHAIMSGVCDTCRVSMQRAEPAGVVTERHDDGTLTVELNAAFNTGGVVGDETDRAKPTVEHRVVVSRDFLIGHRFTTTPEGWADTVVQLVGGDEVTIMLTGPAGSTWQDALRVVADAFVTVAVKAPTLAAHDTGETEAFGVATETHGNPSTYTTAGNVPVVTSVRFSHAEGTFDESAADRLVDNFRRMGEAAGRIRPLLQGEPMSPTPSPATAGGMPPGAWVEPVIAVDDPAGDDVAADLTNAELAELRKRGVR